jgi:hypothetical protein
MYIRFVASVEVRDILGLAWDCGAVTTGPVTVPLVLALGVGVSSNGDDDKDEENEPGSGAAEGEEEGEEDENWASAFGVVTLASLFPVIVVLLFGVVASNVADVNGILDSACVEAKTNAALAPVNLYDKDHHDCPAAVVDGSTGSSSDDDQSLGTILLGDMQAGLQAVCPLVLFLVCVLKFLLHAEIPTVELPDPLNPDPAAEKSGTVIHVSWGALSALIGMIIFYVGLQTGLIALGKSVGNILPLAFTHTDSTPGADPSDNSIGTDSLYCAAEDAEQKKCKRGVALVALFSWFLGFGATCAEPALNTLGITVERLTKGKFKRVMLIGAVSFGVATGITIGVLVRAFHKSILVPTVVCTCVSMNRYHSIRCLAIFAARFKVRFLCVCDSIAAAHLRSRPHHAYTPSRLHNCVDPDCLLDRRVHLCCMG